MRTDDYGSPTVAGAACSPIAPILLAVAALSAAINALSFMGSCLWVAPDTSYYVELAGGIAERLDFKSQLFLIRPPGYPLFLATVFAVFGGASGSAILVIQHAMVVATAVLVAMIAWELTAGRTAALTAGIMTACSLQLIAFANVIMTEAPFTLVLVAGVYFLIVYHLRGGWKPLLWASLLAGVSYLFRPIGMTLVVACVAAATHRLWIERGRSEPQLRRACLTAILAIAPAVAVTIPTMVHNKLIHGGDLSRRCANLALYYRVVCMDKLDSAASPTLQEIRQVVADAVETGALPPGDHKQWGRVWKAYESVRGLGLAEASEVMGRAARELMREHPATTAVLSAKYCYWMLVVPDSFYRFHPGGTPGQITPDGESVRNPQAEIFAASTYEPMMRRWTGPYEEYLHLRHSPKPGRPAAVWTTINRWYYRNIEQGPAIAGILDTPYEAFTWFCLACGAAAMAGKRRTTWMLISFVIALQIVVSAVLAGPTPRYAVPVKPLLLLYPAFAFGCAVSIALALFTFVRTAIAGQRGSMSDKPLSARSRSAASA